MSYQVEKTTIVNDAVKNRVRPIKKIVPVIQTKTLVGHPDDPLEHEADQAAERVVSLWQNGALKAPEAATTPTLAQPIIRRRALSPEVGAQQASPGVTQQIQSAQGGGQPLPGELLPPLEAAFGMDFSGVRLHTDARADALNRDLQARAFTTGQDIFFRQGEYRPGTAEGVRLLGHELGHVGQQGGAFKEEGSSIQRQETPSGRARRAQRPSEEQVERNQNWKPFRFSTDRETVEDSSIVSAIHYNNHLNIPTVTINQIRKILALPRRPGVIGREFILALMRFQSEGGITPNGLLNLDTFFLLNLGESNAQEYRSARSRILRNIREQASLFLTMFQHDQIIRSLRIGNSDFNYNHDDGNVTANDHFAAQLINWRMANGHFNSRDLGNRFSMEEVRLLSGQTAPTTIVRQEESLDEQAPQLVEEEEQPLLDAPQQEGIHPQLLEELHAYLQGYLQERNSIRGEARAYRRRRKQQKKTLSREQRNAINQLRREYNQKIRAIQNKRNSRETPPEDISRIDENLEQLSREHEAQIARLREEHRQALQEFDAESQREGERLEANIPQRTLESDARARQRISDFIVSLQDQSDDFSDAMERLGEQRGLNTPNLARAVVRLIETHRRGEVFQAAHTRQPISMASPDAERQLREVEILQEVRPHESRGWAPQVGPDVNRRATAGIIVLEEMKTEVDRLLGRLQTLISSAEFNNTLFTSLVNDIREFTRRSTQRLRLSGDDSRADSLIVETRNISSMQRSIVMPSQGRETTNQRYALNIRTFLRNLKREIGSRLTGQRAYTGSEPESRFERAVVVNLHLSGVDVCNNQGNPFNISTMHIHPVFAVALYRFLLQLRSIGVTQVWTAGFHRRHRSRADAHPTGRALDITGFKFGDDPTSIENLIHLRGGYPLPEEHPNYSSISRGHSDWFDHQHMLGGRTHREVLLGITEMMTHFFGRIVAPGHNREHMNHFHVELYGNDQTPLVYGIIKYDNMPGWVVERASRQMPGWDQTSEPDDRNEDSHIQTPDIVDASE